MNTTILRLLEEALGVSERRARLERAATWSAEDAREFDSALDAQRVVDPEIWE